MNLTPWRSPVLDPTTGPLVSLQQEIDRLFDQFFQAPLTREGALASTAFQPRVDVRETDSGLQLTAEMPGMSEKDIEINVESDRLTLRGEKRAEVERTESGWRIAERSYGRFERTLSLSSDLDADKAQASFKNGVLTVTVPRKEGTQRKARKLKVAAEH